MAVTVQNLQKRYAGPDGSVVPILAISGLHIADGEQAALVGGSGTGKTTLLHCIAGIVRPDEGHIWFHGADEPPDRGVDIARLSESRRDVFRGRYLGYIFQTHHLLPGLTALENVLLGMSFTGRRADRAWARRLLEEVGLEDRLDYRPAKLSLGQQQRVAVARAMANRPAVVLADEPTGALDPTSAQAVLELIRRLCREVNAALLLVTHDRKIAGQLPQMIELEEINRPGARSEESGNMEPGQGREPGTLEVNV